VSEGDGFAAWMATLAGEPDPLDHSGALSVGLVDFTRSIFRERGAISPSEFEQAYNDRQLELARQAVDMVEADVRRTAGIGEMRFDVGLKEIDDDVNLVISYGGSFQTPVMFSLRHPESTVEVADNLQDHVVELLHRAWPVCGAHDRGLYAQVDGSDAVWYCRSGNHRVSRIGELGPTSG
jgi:hypothetical protein